MSLRRIIKTAVLGLLLLMLIIIVGYAWRAFPIISGYGAKNLASAVYIQHRIPREVISEDLGDFPLSLGSYKVNEKDSSVTGSVWGFARRKAIFRQGLGCTLINDLTEEEVRRQHFDLPSVPSSNTDSITWPIGDKIADTIAGVIDKAMLEKAIDNAMSARTNGKPVFTRAVLVVYDGNIVGERYAPGFGKSTPLLGWSISKSLIGAMIGILVQQGRLDIDKAAAVPEWMKIGRAKIT